MATTHELLDLIHDIADPCENVRAKAVALAGDPAESADVQQATADLAATIEQMFAIARYILNTSTTPH
jgi:hypothetical protein